MNHIYATILLIIIVLLLIYSQQLLKFFTLINLKFKTNKATLVEPSQVDRDILIQLEEIEKFLHKMRFSKKVAIKDYTSIKIANATCYRFYYYNFIEGVHAYVDALKIATNEIEFNIYFETLYDSKKVSITTNRELFLLNSKADYILLFKKDNLELKELYNAHLSDRLIKNETIFKKRLNEKDLIEQTSKREEEALSKLLNRRYIKYINYGFKLRPSFKLFSKAEESSRILGVDAISKKSLKLYFGLFVSVSVALFTILFFTDIKSNNNSYKITNTKLELQKFKENIQNYKGLSSEEPKDVNYTLEGSMKDLDSYLQKSRIKRFIGKPLTAKIERLSLPCKIPNNLEAIYRWHNGIELLVPNRDLFRYQDLQKSYTNFKDKLKTDSSNNFVITVVSKESYRGLSYNCKERGFYEYALGSKGVAQKEFYSIKHFLKVTSQAYKQKAFYDDFDTIKIDLKKFFKIYREYLSSKDKQRYKNLTTYLSQKSNEYINSSKELKLQLLQEITNTYDSSLISKTLPYLKDSDEKVVSKAIVTLGDIGDKSALPALINFLKSKKQRYRDFALLSIAKIVDSTDESLLDYIYPMLNDKSILVRLSAYQVIEKIGSQKSLITLREQFSKEKPAVKLAIIKIFGKIGGDNEFKLLQSYLNEVNKMDFSGEIKGISRGDSPDAKIIQYQIIKAVTQIATRKN